jgi:hypothetical protein
MGWLDRAVLAGLALAIVLPAALFVIRDDPRTRLGTDGERRPAVETGRARAALDDPRCDPPLCGCWRWHTPAFARTGRVSGASGQLPRPARWDRQAPLTSASPGHGLAGRFLGGFVIATRSIAGGAALVGTGRRCCGRRDDLADRAGAGRAVVGLTMVTSCALPVGTAERFGLRSRGLFGAASLLAQ